VSTYEPGTVAILRAPDGREFLAVRHKGGSSPDYWSAPTDWPLGVSSDECDVRPLVAIDPEDREQVARLAGLLLEHRAAGPAISHSGIADALRSLVAPPKPDEPTGHFAVVEDIAGGRWINWRRPGNSGLHECPWVLASDSEQCRDYADIDAVRVLSEGVRDV
jgi:hypothetical protein